MPIRRKSITVIERVKRVIDDRLEIFMGGVWAF